MATYRNCYSILEDVRHGINEYSSNLLTATSTSGKYSNSWLVERINDAQRYIYNLVLKAKPEKFIASSDVTVTDSVITLPWNYGTLIQLRDDKGYPVFPSTVRILPVNSGTGNDNLYYEGANNTLTLNKSGVTETYKLWYTLKPRDLNQGRATADNTVAATSKAIADYYNTMIIESITGAWAGTISDYTAARVVTVTGQTLTDDDYYGIVSELPEPFHNLISPLATMLAKSMHPSSQEKPTKIDYDLWKMQLNTALDVYAGNDGDVSMEEIFTDYNTGDMGLGGVNFPGFD